MLGRFTTRRVADAELPPPAAEAEPPSFLNELPMIAAPEAAETGNPLLSAKLPEEEMKRQIHGLVSQYTLAERLPLNAQELDDFVAEILDEMTGLGPIEPMLKDPTVNDILINGHECVYVDRAGMLEPTLVRFKDESHLLRIVNKI